MTLLIDAAAWLGDQLRASAGITAEYRRLSLTVPITGVVAKQEYEVFDNEGLPERIVSYDWTIKAAELVFGTERFEPREGDTIRVTVAEGAAVTYEVMPLAKRPCFEPLDSADVLLLLHTKRIKRWPHG